MAHRSHRTTAIVPLSSEILDVDATAACIQMMSVAVADMLQEGDPWGKPDEGNGRRIIKLAAKPGHVHAGKRLSTLLVWVSKSVRPSLRSSVRPSVRQSVCESHSVS